MARQVIPSRFGWWSALMPARRGKGSAEDWRGTVRPRLWVAAVLVVCWTVAIEARLLYLQVIRHEALVARARDQQMQTIEPPAKRGDIVDRHGRILAYSVDAESLFADPSRIEDPVRTAALVCEALDRCDRQRREQLERLMRTAEREGRKVQFAWLERQVSPGEEARIRALKLPGIGFVKESRRFYPNREMLAHVLGYVGTDNVGLAGLEATYDSLIRGRPGRVIVHTDAHQQAVFSRVEREPTSGASIELTIDRHLQNIAERELRAGVLEHRAVGGTVIIMGGEGEILAMASYPTFNPNAFGRAPAEVRRNRATQEIYEPGSTFKIVTASAALEENVIEPHDLVDCSPGHIRFGRRVIRDDHTYGVLPFSDVIAKSSNVGAIKVGQRLGAERLGLYINRFGFGRRIGEDFPGESGGIVWNPADLDASALASVSMGYQIGVTPLQMAAAVSTVANGGTLFQPRIVRAIVKDGVRRPVAPRPLRRAISTRTAAELTEMMEAVVKIGTAKAARIDGYTVAGKTGTAKKAIAGGYSDTEFNASFVGFFPSRNPVLSIVVVIDTPRAKGYYGGIVSAPIFKRIAEAAIRYLGIPPTIDPPPPVLLARTTTEATPPTAVRAGLAGPIRELIRADQMPDLRGLSAREALRILTEAGMTAQMTGDGFVVQQTPEAGSPLEPGRVCQLKLDRRPPAETGVSTP